MLIIKGQVLDITDETHSFPEKDSHGEKTGKMKDHRITLITMMWKHDDMVDYVAVKGFDLPASFALPKKGADWTTPKLRNIFLEDGFHKASIAN